ncbi:MAG: VWA domain-containing protein [Acidimicrobiales bacterium]|nr:VWA domain-containing protein [Acidimicrobiales bacterium]
MIDEDLDTVPARPAFPFSAVVGAEDAKLALLLATIDPAIGGVLLRGDKGAAKTTLARGLAALSGGTSNCATSPAGPGNPFVELPLGATEERVVGSLDLTAALTGQGVRVQRGLLAEANGGVLYVDEVNLLADHLVDVLLDVAVSGINRIERDGVSHAHPARFVLVGSMNPEEGDLRPQLLDRFGLAADVRGPGDPTVRAAAVRRRLDFDADASGFVDRWSEAEERLRTRLAVCEPAPITDADLRLVSDLCAAAGAEGLRADLVLARAAAAHAAWQGRHEISADDLRRVAPLVLAHRSRRDPLDHRGAPPDTDRLVEEALERQQTRTSVGSGDPGDQGDRHDDPGIGASADHDRDRASDGIEPGDSSHGPSPDGGGDNNDEGANRGGGSTGPERSTSSGGPSRSDGVVTAAGGPAPVQTLRSAVRDAPVGNGRRSPVITERGRTIGHRPAGGAPTAVAPTATVAAAAQRWAADPAAPSTVEPQDLRAPVRTTSTGNLLVLAVDASGSMGADARMAAVKGALLGLLADAYQRRDRVALVTFGGRGAQVVLRPTGSVEVARTRLEELATGGDTPLAAGIQAALELAVAAATPALEPILVVVTDGRATTGDDPLAAAMAAAAAVARHRLPAVVVDVEAPGPGRLHLAGRLAAAMHARHLTMSDMTAHHLETALRHL